jgi:hypothetical protein
MDATGGSVHEVLAPEVKEPWATPHSAGPSGQGFRDEVAPVAVVEWPREAQRAEQLARERRLRLLVVAPGVTPPVDWDGLSDWVRGPADAGDVYARIEALQRRNALAVSLDPPITLDDDGILRRGGRWVALAAIEERMMRLFLDRPGRVVSRSELLGSTGNDTDSADLARTLDPRVSRLRTHIAPLALHIVNVRRRGFLIQIDAV